jgi:hypothetical protein
VDVPDTTAPPPKGVAPVVSVASPSKQTSIRSHISNSGIGVSAFTAALKEGHDRKLLRWMIMCGIPFNAIGSEYFLDFIKAVQPLYKPPGEQRGRSALYWQSARTCQRARTCQTARDLQLSAEHFHPAPAGPDHLSTSLLRTEYAAVHTRMQERLQNARHVTIIDDGWTTAMRQSAYAMVLVIPEGDERHTFMLGVEDASLDSHTGEWHKGNCPYPHWRYPPRWCYQQVYHAPARCRRALPRADHQGRRGQGLLAGDRRRGQLQARQERSRLRGPV